MPTIAPAFFLIGAQKASTTWLWSMLDQHPGTSLPLRKELHYFGSAELFAKGEDWYLRHFEGLDADKLVGEASTTYFYDRVPYWYNASDVIEYDDSLPLIPELITQRFPDAKFMVILRDPVYRAISAYRHWLKRGAMSPWLGLEKAAVTMPKMRILEYGLYARYLKVWLERVPPERFHVIVYEDQIKKDPLKTIADTYEFLGLDPGFTPALPEKRVHRSWGLTRIVFNYYASKIVKNIGRSQAAGLLDRFDVLSGSIVKDADIEYLRSVYLPERDEISTLIGRELSNWDYGERLLRRV